MEGQLRDALGGPPGQAIRDAVDAARRLDGMGHDRPAILAVHPPSRNPFQELLYRHLWERGIAPIPLPRIEELDDLAALSRQGVATILHLHWTSRVLAAAPDEAAGRRSVADFLGRLDRFLDKGGRLVWTVHNVLPHDARFPPLEAELQQAIVDRASVVHVLAAGTVAAAKKWFTIPPEKVLHVAHPAYQGVYEDSHTRHAARHRLSIEDDEIVYGLLGAIKPYKGLSLLLEAFDELIADDPRPRRLLVAGAPDEAAATVAFLERCRNDPRISLHAGRIANDELHLFLRATDVAVLPYEHVLNSGVLLLAVTFGLPVVAPSGLGMGELVSAAFARTFAPGDRAALLGALRGADELIEPGAREQAREAALAFAAEHHPDGISDAFAQGLLERVLDP